MSSTQTPASGLAVAEAIAPEVINLIAGIVHKQAPIAEANNGPLTGPVKFAQVLDVAMKGLQAAFAAGQIPSFPGQDVVKSLVQTAVTVLKLPGGILADPTALPPSPQAVVGQLPTGQTFELTIVGGKLRAEIVP